MTTPLSHSKVAVIGAGLAGSEAALVLARFGVQVTLFESRPNYQPPAHLTALPAELVCSNSLKSCLLPSAHGLLKAELSHLESPLIAAAYKAALPAGSALAVNREQFSHEVMSLISAAAAITFVRKEITSIPEGFDAVLIAAGPLCSPALTTWIAENISADALNFYDAIAPIIAHDSIDFSIAFSASRWEEGEGDYINCPFNEEEYRAFYDALREADTVTARSFENSRFFESCLPIEVAAARDYKALTFGPLRPIGIDDPRTGRWPFAICQLRKEQVSGESYNMVGFQTRLTIPEQKRVFRLIPGLANAEFLRYGSIHRNTYLNSPVLLSGDLSFKKYPSLFLAGQLCGNEGYTESIATGHLAARAIVSRLTNAPWNPPPLQSALGAMLNHVIYSPDKIFTPSNINFGLFPPLETTTTRRKIGKKEKHQLLCDRALEAIKKWQG